MAPGPFFTPSDIVPNLSEQHVLSDGSSAIPVKVESQDSQYASSSSISQPTMPSLTEHPKHSKKQSPSRHEPWHTNTTTPTIQPLGELSVREPTVSEKAVGWRDLPKKGQLAILTLARLSEPIAERSLSAYIFYQIRSFDPSQSESKITSQGGLLTAAFAGAQCFTAVWWGRAADSPRIGRKTVILIGLTGTAVATLGVGFSRNFATAITWRLIAGALNGNIGVMRTMVSEMIEDRKYQSRAFLLLPMCFNIGVVIGPMLGGILADPIKSFPSLFGPGSVFGGKNGVGWMTTFPYALPNLVSATFIFLAALSVSFGLDETHYMLKNRQGWSRRIGKNLYQKLSSRSRSYDYQPINSEDTESYPMANRKPIRHNHGQESAHSRSEDEPLQMDGSFGPGSSTASAVPSKGFTSIFTSNILLTLASHFLVALHISSFNTLIFLFLPNPRAASNPSSLSLRFSGGLGMSSFMVGVATSLLGIIGLPLQFLFFPNVKARLGTLKSYRTFLPFSALAYTMVPFLVLIQQWPLVLWPMLALSLGAQVLSRTFTLPLTVILVNNSAPSASVLGTVHGLAQTVSAAARTIGPYFSSLGLGWGLNANCVGAVWWALAGVVGLNWSLLWMIWEGDGRGGRMKG